MAVNYYYATNCCLFMKATCTLMRHVCIKSVGWLKFNLGKNYWCMDMAVKYSCMFMKDTVH